MSGYDCIVLGTGGVGSAALFHFARRGIKVLGLDRFAPAHDRGSSHGQTRMIRQAYFEHPDYVPLVRRAYKLWEELEELSGEKLYREVGLLEIGPADGLIVPGVLRAAAEHQLPVEQLSVADIQQRFPGFSLRGEPLVGLFEHRAGYLRVEACVRAHLRAAQQWGVELLTGVTVQSWRVHDDHVEVTTDRGTFAADRLAITAGAWAGQALADLGLPLQIRRKPQYWFRTDATDYLADAIGSLWPDASWLRDWSMFHLVKAQPVLQGTIPTAELALLVGIGAIAVIYAWIAFPRRDLAAPS